MAIKLFHSGQDGSPTLNGVNGALITVLDAVLVDGYNTVNVTSITRSGTTATVTTAAAHGFKTNDSALIAGAAQTDYNIEAVVSVVNGTQFTYTVAGSPTTPATGTITVKRAPAGFDKAFSDTNKAAYRSKDVTGTRPYLQIIDDGTTAGGAREAKTRGYLLMTDVDTGSDPFPTAVQYPNGLMTYKSSTIDATARPWVLITDGKTFYFQANVDQSPASGMGSGGFFWWLGFGDINSTRAGDQYSGFLAACHASNQTTSTVAGACHNGMTAPAIRTATPGSGSCYVVRSFSQVAGAQIMNHMGHGWDQTGLGQLAVLPHPHPPDNGFVMIPMTSYQGGVMRGRLPGVFESYHGRVLNQFNTVDNVTGYAGRKFIGFWGYALNSTSSTGLLMFDLTGDSNGKWS